MIELPKRSVTRFFIPLIDVMTLLFCIFLLMPIVKPDSSSEAGSTSSSYQAAASNDSERKQLEELRKKVEELERASSPEKEREELEQIRTAKIEALEKRLAIRILEIDGDTGNLSYYDHGQRVPITNESDARALIQRQKQQVDGQDLFYLFLYPRKFSGEHPTRGKIEQYQRWFADYPQAIDNSRSGREDLP